MELTLEVDIRILVARLLDPLVLKMVRGDVVGVMTENREVNAYRLVVLGEETVSISWSHTSWPHARSNLDGTPNTPTVGVRRPAARSWE